MAILIAQQFLNGLGTGMGYALVALGLTVIFGVLHVINFAHGQLYMLGALGVVVAMQSLDLPYLAAILISIVACLAIAFVADRIAVGPVLSTRDGPATVLLSTFAVGMFIDQMVLGARGPAPVRVDGIEGAIELGDLVLTHQRLFVIVAGVLLLALVEWTSRRTRFGIEMHAIAQNAFAAAAVGIDVVKVRSWTFVAAGGLAAASGALLVPTVLFSTTMGQNLILKAFVIVVIGGMGSVTGAVVCGLGLGVLEALIGIVMPQGFALALIYGLLLVGLLFRPQGLFRAFRTA